MTLRVCACGCGVDLSDRRSNVRYAADACKSRHWKARTGYAVQATRKPCLTPSGGRSGIQASYRKAVAVVAADYQALNLLDPEQRAQDVLRAALSDRQRARLAEREAA